MNNITFEFATKFLEMEKMEKTKEKHYEYFEIKFLTRLCTIFTHNP